jgi:hypothetical protein
LASGTICGAATAVADSAIRSAVAAMTMLGLGSRSMRMVHLPSCMLWFDMRRGSEVPLTQQ